MRRLTADDYTVGWFCPLDRPELQVSQLLFDQEHEPLSFPQRPDFLYKYGEMNGNNVVMASLPFRAMGIVPAADVTREMRSYHPRLKFCLLVGVGGGVPQTNGEVDLRLGDVVVGVPNRERRHGGIIQYDYGKARDGGVFEPIGFLNKPDDTLLSAVTHIRASGTDKVLLEYLDVIHRAAAKRGMKDGAFQKPKKDVLFRNDHVHRSEGRCDEPGGCDEQQQVERFGRSSPHPEVHYGTVASGNQVIKDAERRDRLVKQDSTILCFEMEAAGIANSFPCLAIRGICDYCDSHKNSDWQPYAAAVAAAYARWMLQVIPSQDVKLMVRASTVVQAQEWMSQTPKSVVNASLVADRAVAIHSLPPPGSAKFNQWLSLSCEPSRLVLPNKTSKRAHAALSRLSTYEAPSVLRRIATQRMKGTGQWWQSNPAFQQWLQSRGPSCLWLSGKVGSGKTVAMATAIRETLDSPIRRAPGLVLFYFFEYPAYSATHFIQSLIKQTLNKMIARQKPCPPRVLDELISLYKKESSNPDCYDLFQRILEPLISMQKRGVAVIVDGLDECSVDEQDQCWTMLRMLVQAQPSTGIESDRRLLISGEDSIGKSLLSLHIANFDRLRIDRDHAPADIDHYIDEQMRRYAHNGQILGNERIRNEVKHELSKNAHGMFLWVRLQIQTLQEDCRNVAEVRAKLKELPRDLLTTYLKRLGRRDGAQFVCDPVLIKWVCAVPQAMTTQQIAQMLVVDPATGYLDSERVFTSQATMDSGVGLVDVDDHSNCLYPIHPTVRTFIFSKDAMPVIRSIAQSRTCNGIGKSIDALRSQHLSCCAEWTANAATAQLGTTCLLLVGQQSLLAKEEASQAKPILALIPALRARPRKDVDRSANSTSAVSYTHHSGQDPELLNYATANWAPCTKDITEASPCWQLFSHIVLNPNRKSTLSIYPWSTGRTENTHLLNAMSYAISIGHSPLARMVLGRSHVLPKGVWDLPLPESLRPALHVACELGQLEILKMLLPHCSINAPDVTYNETPLHLAAAHGRLDIVKLLLNSPKVKAELRNELGLTPLALAAINGNTDVVALLCKTPNVDCNARDVQGSTPLHHACARGNAETVSRLLEVNAIKPDLERYDNSTSLVIAARLGLDNIVGLLVRRADVNINRLHKGTTALGYAALFSHTKVAQKLLAVPGIVPDARLPNHKTPLEMGAEVGSVKIVQMLLSRAETNGDVDINGGESSIWHMPLGLAVRSGKEETVSAMLDHAKTKLQIPEPGSEDYLSFAARSGLDKVVKALLKRSEVDVNIRGVDGMTPMMWASFNGSARLVETFLAQPQVDVNASDDFGRTALAWASSKGHAKVAKLFLANKFVDVNTSDWRGRTPLWVAAEMGHWDTARILASHVQSNIEHEDQFGQNLRAWCLRSRRTRRFYALVSDKRERVRRSVRIQDSGRSDSSDAWSYLYSMDTSSDAIDSRDDSDVSDVSEKADAPERFPKARREVPRSRSEHASTSYGRSEVPTIYTLPDSYDGSTVPVSDFHRYRPLPARPRQHARVTIRPQRPPPPPPPPRTASQRNRETNRALLDSGYWESADADDAARHIFRRHPSRQGHQNDESDSRSDLHEEALGALPRSSDAFSKSKVSWKDPSPTRAVKLSPPRPPEPSPPPPQARGGRSRPSSPGSSGHEVNRGRTKSVSRSRVFTSASERGPPSDNAPKRPDGVLYIKTSDSGTPASSKDSSPFVLSPLSDGDSGSNLFEERVSLRLSDDLAPDESASNIGASRKRRLDLRPDESVSNVGAGGTRKGSTSKRKERMGKLQKGMLALQKEMLALQKRWDELESEGGLEAEGPTVEEVEDSV